MSALQQASALVAASHRCLIAWVRARVAEAGLPQVTVRAGAPRPGQGPTVSVLPYLVGPWPKVVETLSAVNLIGGADDNGSTVPELWRRFGRALGAAVDASWPTVLAGGRSRPHPLPPLELLPEPLAAWYASQPEDPGPGAWRVSTEGRPCARLPSLTWRPALNVRMSYLVLAGASGDEEDEGLGLAALGALSVAMNMDRVLRVRMPSAPADPGLYSLASALADSVDEEIAEDLRTFAGQIQGEVDQRMSLVPGASRDGEEHFERLRSLGLPLQPCLHIALHAPLGAGPEFGPGSSPSVATGRPPNAPPAGR